jgi:hypothetical protein
VFAAIRPRLATSIISARVVLDCLAAQIRSGKLGKKAA